MGQAAQRGPWTKAFYQYIDKPKYTNRDASGLVRFARNIVNTVGRQPDVSLTPWDWYAYALPLLGWFKTGDKFKIDTKWQLQPYVASRQLRDALLTMATELDEAAVPFKPSDPRGSDAVYRQLAIDAWDAMKNLRAQGLPEGGQPPPELQRAWEGEPIAATLPSSPIATSASSAAKKPTKPKKETEPREQLDLPGVPPITIQPAEPMEPKKGGGGLWLLLLLALGSKRKRGGKRR